MARYTFSLGTIFDPAQAIEELGDDESATVLVLLGLECSSPAQTRAMLTCTPPL
jgi:hypothetical protein